MRYKKFKIKNYKAISKELTIDLSPRLIPLIGINECGKTTILQAIFCFDEENDDLYEGSHISNRFNLYEPSDNGPTEITAVIECTREELDLVYEEMKADSGLEIQDDFAETDGQITITRILNGRSHYISSLNFYEPSEEEKKPYDEEITSNICSCIIQNCPAIIYSDDFNDRPPSCIDFKSNSQSGNFEWKEIFKRIAKEAGVEEPFNNIFEVDERRQQTVLSRIASHINQRITDEWLRFSENAKDLFKIELRVKNTPTEQGIKIQINDRVQDNDNYFDLSDRSKGFIWHYNFIMKTLFNSKPFKQERETIFLLDEPGSYLHVSVQALLCKKLKEISEKEGVVIYSTHSSSLLDIKYIPSNNILIVDKESNTSAIQAIPITKKKTATRKSDHLQPLYEALRIPHIQTSEIKNHPIICVEGISDLYAIKSFCDLPENAVVIPGANAASIVDTIQHLIAWGANYVALWDNDREGEKEYAKAKKTFGEGESHKFLLLPAPSKTEGKRRMEEMFSSQTISSLKGLLGMEEDTNYEALIRTLHFIDQEKKSFIIKKSLDTQTKKIFSLLSRNIKEALK